MRVRETSEADIPALMQVVDATGLFPSDLLPDLVQGFLSGEESNDLWLTCESDGKAVGFCYTVAEELAEGTWNMLALAVSPDVQSRGGGALLVSDVEARLAAQGQRVLIVDTSGTDQFVRTRSFYKKNGYTEEARIRDFWAPGDDKVVFWKSLTD